MWRKVPIKFLMMVKELKVTADSGTVTFICVSWKEGDVVVARRVEPWTEIKMDDFSGKTHVLVTSLGSESPRSSSDQETRLRYRVPLQSEG